VIVGSLAFLFHRRDAEGAEKNIFSFSVERSRLNHRDDRSDLINEWSASGKLKAAPCSKVLFLETFRVDTSVYIPLIAKLFFNLMPKADSLV
jgi:hypothetical protein